MKRSTFLFTLSLTLVLTFTGFAQSIRKLEQNEFDTDILNQWWSFEDAINKGSECDMRIFIVKSSGFDLNCVNWANGFTGSKCGYVLDIKEDFFELKAKDCEKSINPGFIYGYLTGTNLFLLISGKQLTPGPGILSEKNWYKFGKIKR